MDALTLTSVCILCAATPSVPANVARWESLIAEASVRFSIPKTWIERIMQAESGGRTTLNGKPITSPAGAIGLMQIMPNTYVALSEQYGFGSDPYDPHDNIFAGTAYLEEMYARYGYPLLFAAYLTGPTHLDRYLLGSRSLPSNVIAYVNSIAPNAISQVEPDLEQRNSHFKSTNDRHPNSIFFTLTSSSNASRSSEQTGPNVPSESVKSVFIGADRPSNLFVFLPLQNR